MYFLLIFLNTDFENNEDCKSFIFWFCFEYLYYRKYDHEAGFSQKDINDIIQEEKNYYENKSIKYNETEINGYIENLNINFETFGLLFENIDITKYNIPYSFESEDILAILALMF